MGVHVATCWSITVGNSTLRVVTFPQNMDIRLVHTDTMCRDKRVLLSVSWLQRSTACRLRTDWATVNEQAALGDVSDDVKRPRVRLLQAGRNCIRVS